MEGLSKYMSKDELFIMTDDSGRAVAGWWSAVDV